MAVTSPFGFISYNSRDFLQRTLQTFIDDKKFLRCACWYHESTGTEKNHFHCWVEPAVPIEVTTLAENFIELDENGNQQSIAIRPRCRSKWVDAYLYGIHDSDYLASKGKVRELVNIKTDMHIYLGDFKADIAEAEYYLFKSCIAPYAKLKKLVYEGKTLEEVYIILRIPFAQLKAVSNAYSTISKLIDIERQNELIERQEELFDNNDKAISEYKKLSEETKKKSLVNHLEKIKDNDLPF